MSAVLAIGMLLLGYALVGVLLAALLRTTAAWMGIEKPGWRRALGAVLIVGLVCLAVTLPMTAWKAWLEEASLSGPGGLLPVLQWTAPYLAFGLQILGACGALWWWWRVPWDVAFMVAAVLLVGVLAAGQALHTVLRWVALESIAVPAAGMAPAVRGLCAPLTCANCGFEYDVGMAERLLMPRWSAGKPKTSLCPNCRYANTISSDAGVHQGERVLVDRLGGLERWQIALLQHPKHPERYLLNRVVGLPGESLELLGGDVFLDGRRAHKPPALARDMWLPVHDTAFLPASVVPDAPSWRPAAEGSRWRKIGTSWRIGSGAEFDALQYAGPIQDELSYNDVLPGQGPAPATGDIRLECAVSECAGANLEIRWEFLERTAVVDVAASGDVLLTVQDRSAGADMAPVVHVARAVLTGGLQSDAQFEFLQCDGEVRFVQQGRVLAALDLGPDEALDMRRLLVQHPQPRCRLAVAVRQGGLTLGRLRLSRDVYYRAVSEIAPAAAGAALDFPPPVTLPPGGLFVLGDNSARSEDSRFFGSVARRVVVGRAMAVYWPPTRWRGL